MKKQTLEEALEEFAACIDRWVSPKGSGMAKVFAGDRKNMREVLRLCRKGDWNKAAYKARSMDTILRENIPDLLWEKLARDV